MAATTKKKPKLLYVTMAKLHEPWDVTNDPNNIEQRGTIIRVEDQALAERFVKAKVEMEMCWEELMKLAREQNKEIDA